MKPFNPIQLPLPDLDWKRFRRLVGPSNAALARYDGILQAMLNPEVLLSPLMTWEAVLSSRIEGTMASVEEVLEFEASEKSRPERIDDVMEVLNYRSAMRAATASLEKRPICLNLVREAHKMLLSGVRGRDKGRGEFRREQNYIGRYGASLEEATYVPPEPGQVVDLLSNWEHYIHFDEDDRLVQLALVHAQFELIHPFLDGNGRVGRMLIPLFLYEKKLLSSPMFYLSEYLEANRDEYYTRLRALSEANDWEGWVAFFLAAVLEQAKRNTTKASRILDLYNVKKTKVADLTHSQHAIRAVDALFMTPIFRAAQFVKLSGIPTGTARRILKMLAREAVIRELRPGSGSRGAVYIFPKLMAITEGLDEEEVPE